MSKVLGVLDGMGPAATVAFLARVQALTPAEGDQDHIRILADINPQVPDRNRQPDAAEKTLGQMAMRLRDAGFLFLDWPTAGPDGRRLVTSPATSEDDVEALIELAA